MQKIRQQQNSNNMNKFFFPLLFSAVFLFSCSSDESSSLINNQWVLISYGNESGEVLKEANGYFYMITFNPDGTYSGKAYGNKLDGKYGCTGNTVKIIDYNITLVSVEGADNDAFFIENLCDDYLYTIINDELKLVSSKGFYFKFRKMVDASE